LSDVSQGPGWWQASNLKWYPPHLHASVLQALPSPPPSAQVVQSQTQSAPAPPPGYAYQVPGVPPWTAPPPQREFPFGYGPPPGPGNPPPTTAQLAVFNDPVLAVPLAPWWKRLVAVLVDGAILTLIYLVALVIFALAAGNNSNSNNSHLGVAGAIVGGIILGLVALLPVYLYFGIMNGSKRGQTLGKMAMSIAARDARTGQRIGFWRGVGRSFISILFFVFLFIPFLLDSLAPLWSARRQAWHDSMVRSVVVDLKP